MDSPHKNASDSARLSPEDSKPWPDTVANAFAKTSNTIAQYAPIDSILPSQESVSNLFAPPSASESETDFIFTDLYNITVRLIRGEVIPADLNGKSDPYVRLTLGTETLKSSIAKNTLHPVWNEQFNFVTKNRPEKLLINVKDKSVIRRKDLGFVEIDLKDIIKQGSSDSTPTETGENASKSVVVFNDWVALQGVKSGKIFLQIESSLIPMVVGRTSDELATIRGVEELITLIELNVCSAWGFKNRDILSKPDPFVMVQFGPNSYRTNVCRNTTKPEWNETLKIWTTRQNENFVMRIAVYDREVVTASRLLGVLFIKPALFELNRYYDLDLPLTMSDLNNDSQLNEMMSKIKIQSESNSDETTKGATAKAPTIRLKLQIRSQATVEDQFYDYLLKAYDFDNNGRLSLPELAHFCNTIGVTISDEQMNDAIKEAADKPTDLELDKSGIVKLFRTKTFTERSILKVLHGVMTNGGDCLNDMLLNDFAYKRGKKTVRIDTIKNFNQDDDDGPPQFDNSSVQLLVQDRRTGLIVTELVPSYVKSAMKLMNRTILGRTFTNTDKVKKLLMQLTIKQGEKMNSPKSVKLIPSFVKLHKINIDEIEKPLSEYKTFNQFFSRRLKPGAREDAAPGRNDICISPADCRLNVFESVSLAQSLWIKGEKFTISRLLGGYDPTGSIAQRFAGGPLVISRLAPQDYHRYHLPINCKLQKRFSIPGCYWTVNPVAVRTKINVYTENHRVICPMQSDEFGEFLFICIGATMVGSIAFDECFCKDKTTFRPDQTACEDGACLEGQTRGKFSPYGTYLFGGSTCLILFLPGAIEFDADLRKNSLEYLETLVRVGDQIGISTGKYRSRPQSRENSTTQLSH